MPMATEERKNLCVLANDARLIEAGPGAFGAHAARLAGLSAPDQEKVAEAAVRIARGAFEQSRAAGSGALRVRLAVANLADSVKVSMEAEGAGGPAGSNIFDVAKENLAGAKAAASAVRWQAQPGACLLTITKTPEARNLALHSGTLCLE
jgi:hypothetical protein